MNDRVISRVVEELKPLLAGRRFGKVFQLSPESFAIDFGLREGGYLFVSVEPALPRVYLIKRRLRELEKQSMPPGQFSLSLKKELSQAELVSIEKEEDERIVRFKFGGIDELDRKFERTLLVQLTGRAANVHILDEDGVIKAQARPGRGIGQQPGEVYERPPKPRGITDAGAAEIDPDNSLSISETLDTYYAALLTEQAFDSHAAAARAKLRKQITQAQRLLTKLSADLASHANSDEHKRMGDLLLANAGTARRKGDRVALVDYFADGTPQIEVEVDEKMTLPEAAAQRFAQYSRSKRALAQIEKRIELARSELIELEKQQGQIEAVIAGRDAAGLAAFATAQPQEVKGQDKTTRSKRIAGVRQYRSSDGFEILVGRASHDNDNLTFKIARPNDLWLHAADYPGSHVIVRNPTRKDLPHTTLIEAAQLAAYFSQANKNPKVDVHHTARKFVSKLRGGASGLVRITRQKSIAVEPREAGTRINV
ncbi:MAG TPA: NFACT RNA binding domain-containing protein [Pyrinomonadaceae bacterium]|nr:NFACT RNA binding domain-containing protein [Pyrinomonadaceae bacterium]